MKKYNYNSSWYKTLTLIFLFAVGVICASAQTTAGTGDWNTATANAPWPSGLPATNGTITVNRAITLNGIVVNTGFAITIASGGTITIGASGFLNAASITIQTGGTLNMTAAGVINLSGTLTNSGGTYTTGAGVVNSYVYYANNFSTTTNTSAAGPPVTITGGTPSVTFTTGGSSPIGLASQALRFQTSSTIGYASAAFSSISTNVLAPFTSTLSNNTGLVTWYSTIRNQNTTATTLSQVLVSNNSVFTTTNNSGSNDNVGYAVSILPGTTNNKVELSSFTGGASSLTRSAIATIDNFAAAQDYVNVKVTYNPFTQQWTLAAVNSGNTTSVDPTLSTYTNTTTPTTNTTWTSTAMTHFGFHGVISGGSNFFDNYYITTTPILNVTSSNTLTKPVSALTAMSGFTYVQSTSGPSVAQSFFINSGGISNSVTVAVSNNTNWEISKDGSTGWGSTLTYTPSSNLINSGITNGNQVFVRLKSGLSAGNFISNNITISSTGIATQTVTLSGSVTNIITPTSLTIANSTDNRQYLTWGSASSNILVFASTASDAYTPSGDATTVYTGANAALGSASTFSSGGNTYYLVAAGTGSNVEVTGLANGTTYYYQVFSYNGSTYSSAASGTSTSATTAMQPVTGFTATNASAQSVLSWTNPTFNATQSNYWDEVIVIASTGTITAPTGDGSSYTSNSVYGSGTSYGSGFVVYKGTGTGVPVTGLTNFTNYNYAVYVRHGSVWSAATSVTKMALPISSLTSGDFVSTATGSYSASSTWNVWDGTVLQSTVLTPGSTNNVWIAGGYTVTNSLTTGLNAPQLPSAFIADNSLSNANCKNLYVVNGSLIGTDGTAGQTTPTVVAATGPVNGVFVSGTAIEVGTNGKIGNTNLSPTSNGISFYLVNSGTTKIDNYASQTGGTIDIGRIIIYRDGTGTPTLQIARSINLHYNGGAHGGNYALALQNAFNTISYVRTPTATITIDNGATVTMDKSCYIAPYVATNTTTGVYPVNFTLNVNGTLTFTDGAGNGATNAFTNNGFLAMGSTIANTGSAGTGSFLNIGSTGVINVPEFYPNGSNGVTSTGFSTSYGRNTGINIASGGQLNISTVADFSVAGGQTFSGAGSINFTGTGTYPAPIVYLGSSTGLNAIMASGSKTFNGAATIYSFRAPTAWVNATVYTIGQQVTSNGNIYTITTGGTSGATAPSGTGTFTDNSVAYAYINSAAQATGSSLPATVKGLILSNASGITLSGATTVTDTLRQTSTVLTASSSAAVLTINSLITTLPTFSSTNYIAGPVTLYSAANTSAQTLNFPVGMNSDYLPLSLSFTQAAATATAYTVVPTVGTVTHGYAGLGNVQGVSSSRYYTISAGGNSFTNGSITMSYSTNDDDNIISLATASNIRIAQNTSGLNWTNLGGTGSANVTGTITSTTAFTTLGQFAIGNQTVSLAAPTFSTASGATVSANFTIPYTLSSYDATWQNVLLNGGGSITYGGVVLTKNTDYTVSASGITIIPNIGSNAAVLRASGTITILVAAPGYTTRTISQVVSPGTATKLAITTQPAPSATLDGVVLTTSPIIVVQDAFGNTVTSSTATINATVGSGSSTYFSLGGVTAVAASSGVATFTGITAINRSATNITGFITFTSSGLTSVTSGAGVTPMTIQKPTTYYWVGTPGGVQNATAWSSSATTLWNTALNGSGTTPSSINSTDIYVVDGTNVGGASASTVAVTLRYSGNFSVGQLRIINNAQVALLATAGATSTITVLGANGGSSGDLYIAGGTSSLTTHSNTATAMVLQSGTSFVLASGGTFSVAIGTLTFATGSTATIGGTLNVAATGSGTASVTLASGTTATITGAVVLGSGTSTATLIGVGANSINFNSGSTCTLNTSTNPFGTASTTPVAGIGSVVFANGSLLTITKAFDIFAGTRKVVSFGKTSSLVNNYTSATALLIDGNTFGNLTFTQSVNPTTPGANGFTCNNLTVNSGTFTLAQTGSVNITGNITIATGATLNASPASAVVINLNGTSAQTVTNSGTLTLGANTTLRANNSAGVSLGSSLTIPSTLTLASGNFSIGANTLTFANLTNTGGTLVTTSSSSLSYTGTGSITLPSSITALANLSNAGRMTIGNGSVTLSGNLVNGTGSVVGSASVSGNVTNSGTISGTVSVIGNLTNNSTGTMPGTVSVAGNLVNTGTLSGTVTLNGSSVTAQTITGGTGKITNLTLNNSVSGATVSTGSQSISGTLTVTNGVLNAGSKGIILKSTSIANSAVVAPVTGTGSITGTVQVERFIPKGYRAWRDMAPGVFNTGISAGSIFNNWQEAGSYANAGYGLFITGTTTSNASHAVDATTGLDQTTNSVKSAYTFTNGTWNAVTNAKTTILNPFLGYRLLVRGDRTANLYTTPVSTVGTTGWLLMYTSTALRATGNLITGNVVYSTSGITNSVAGATYNNASFGLNSSSANGFSSVANPYVAPIDWKNIWDNNRAENLTASYYYLDPTIGSAGAYVSYNAITDATSNGSLGTRRYIQAGQAFFVENNSSTAPSLTITEADKAISSTKTTVFGSTSRSRLAINLMKTEGSESKQMDGATLLFDQQFSNGIGREDARKMTNPGENLAINHDGQSLSIEGRLPATANERLPLTLSQLASSDYQFSIDASAFKAENLDVFLVDTIDNSETLLTAAINNISFKVDATDKATYANRFSLVFKAASKSATNPANIATSTMSIYPNPMVGKTVAVRLGSEVAVGKYVVSMYNSLGQQVYTAIINHSGANATETITTSSKLATGVYQLNIKSCTTNQLVATSNLAVE